MIPAACVHPANQLCGLWLFWNFWAPCFIFVCLWTRLAVCICLSAYVQGLGSGTPEYIHWNVKCVFRAARNVSQTHCNNFKGHDHCVCVCVWGIWVIAGDWCMSMKGLFFPMHVFIYANTCKTRAHTASHLSPSVESNVYILIGVCFVRQKNRESLSQSLGLSFCFAEVLLGQRLAGAWWFCREI